MRLQRPGFPRPGPGTFIAALGAAGLFWIAYDNGAYGLASRSTLAIGLWWGFIVVLAFGLWPRTPMPRAATLAGGLMTALGLWTFASLRWTPNAEATFEEFNRVSLYLGIFVVVVLVSRRSNLARFADGIALAVTGVAAVALISRLFPGSFPEGDLPTFLPGTVTRLSFPLGYWNGLAIFLALGVPLLLRLALVARQRSRPWAGACADARDRGRHLSHLVPGRCRDGARGEPRLPPPHRAALGPDRRDRGVARRRCGRDRRAARSRTSW